MILTIGERDLFLLQIETEINNKKKLLLKKKKDLDKKQQVNQFLNGVTKDYQKYYNHILNEKQQQYKMLLLLKEYLNDLIKTEDLVDEQRRTAKHDQQNILKEIDKVKGELDDLIK
jgi:cell division septum initiation protein DivIVA